MTQLTAAGKLRALSDAVIGADIETADALLDSGVDFTADSLSSKSWDIFGTIICDDRDYARGMRILETDSFRAYLHKCGHDYTSHSFALHAPHDMIGSFLDALDPEYAARGKQDVLRTAFKGARLELVEFLVTQKALEPDMNSLMSALRSDTRETVYPHFLRYLPHAVDAMIPETFVMCGAAEAACAIRHSNGTRAQTENLFRAIDEAVAKGFINMARDRTTEPPAQLIADAKIAALVRIDAQEVAVMQTAACRHNAALARIQRPAFKP